MRYLLSILLSVLSVPLFAAPGDIKWVTVDSNGWSVLICAEGLQTNGTYNLGWGTNNIPTGTERLVLSVTSPGFDSSGEPITRQRTVYGGKQVRLPFPNEALNDEFILGSDLVFRISLTDGGVFSGDSAITADIALGLYEENDGTNQPASAISVTNNSAAAYPKAVANWSWPGWQRETNANMRLRAVGGHGMAPQLGQPLAAMQFIVSDETGTRVTNTVSAMSIDWALNKLAPFWGNYGVDKSLSPAEYVSDFALSSFVEHEQLRCDFKAFPHIGDSGAVLETTANGYTGITALPTSITNLCDPAATYAPFIAVVDPISGSDANGRATNTTYDLVNSGHFFATVAGAWNFISDSNAAFATTAHGDPGGGRVYIHTGGTTDFNWTGAAMNPDVDSVTAKVWCETLTFPGQPQAVMTNRVSDRNVGNRTKLTNIKIAVVNPAVPFNATTAVWFDQCNFDTAGTALIQTCPLVYVTHCTVTNMQQGLRPNTAANATAFAIIRGNNMDGFDDGILIQTVIGNLHPNTNGGGNFLLAFELASQALPSDCPILYGNYFGGHNSVSSGLTLVATIAPTNGAFVANNVFEKSLANQPLADIASAAGAPNSTNIIVWNNVWEGGRIADLASSGVETSNVWRWVYSLSGNVWAYPGQKDDTTPPQSAARIGGWPVLWMVGGRGNFYIRNNVAGSTTAFRPAWAGVSTYEAGVTNVDNYVNWIDRKAATADTSTSGGGNYRVHSDSPVQGLHSWTLPFDIVGNNRGAVDPPGAYSSASPRKGGGFF